MKISRFTTFASVLAIVALIVGFSACDQSQQLLFPGPPETGLPGENHHRCPPYRLTTKTVLCMAYL